MSNNKQSSVEWLAEQLTAKMQMWNSTKNYQEFHIVLEAGEFAKLIEQAKLMHKEEQSRFTIDYFNWLHNNQYKYNPKVKMYQKMMINETLFFTIEELMIEFNKTLGGIDEKQQGI